MKIFPMPDSQNGFGGRKDIAFSLGYGTLISSPVWWDVINLTQNPSNQYYIPVPISREIYISCLIVVLASVAASLALLIAARTVQGKSSVFRYLFPLIATGLVTWQILKVTNLGWVGAFSFVSKVGWIGKIGASVSLVLILASTSLAGIRRRLYAVAGFVFPLFILVEGQLIYYGLTLDKKQDSGIIQPARSEIRNNESGRNKQSVILLIFDELDFHHVFERRPEGYVLAGFDDMAGSSINFLNALSPADVTLLSVPSIFDGVGYLSALPKGSRALQLDKGGQAVLWGSNTSIVDDANRLGLSSFITGWAHPYCKILAGKSTWCFSNGDSYLGAVDITLVRRTYQMAGNLLSPSNDCFFQGGIYSNKHFHRKAYEEIAQHSLGLLKAESGLHFVHLPVPHGPNISQSISQHLGCGNDPEKYFGNVALADEYLRKLIEILKASGRWDQSLIIVTSDHWWRESWKYSGVVDKRVPLFVKLPGQDNRIEVKEPINTVFVRAVINGFYNREWAAPLEFLRWLKKNGILGTEINPIIMRDGLHDK